MVCMGVDPGVAGWKAHTNPLSYGGTLTGRFYRITRKTKNFEITSKFLNNVLKFRYTPSTK